MVDEVFFVKVVWFCGVRRNSLCRISLLITTTNEHISQITQVHSNAWISSEGATTSRKNGVRNCEETKVPKRMTSTWCSSAKISLFSFNYSEYSLVSLIILTFVTFSYFPLAIMPLKRYKKLNSRFALEHRYNTELDFMYTSKSTPLSNAERALYEGILTDFDLVFNDELLYMRNEDMQSQSSQFGSAGIEKLLQEFKGAVTPNTRKNVEMMLRSLTLTLTQTGDTPFGTWCLSAKRENISFSHSLTQRARSVSLTQLSPFSLYHIPHSQ